MLKTPQISSIRLESNKNFQTNSSFLLTMEMHLPLKSFTVLLPNIQQNAKKTHKIQKQQESMELDFFLHT